MASFELKVPAIIYPKRLDIFLKEAWGGRYSRQEVKRLLDEGVVRVNGCVAKPKSFVREGDEIVGVLPSPKPSELLPEPIPLRVIYEDECLLVIDKPSGLVVHPGAGNRQGTLVHALLSRGSPLSSRGGSERPGIVHRLDKETSGLLVVAKDNRSHRHLQAQLESRTFSKHYTALVHGVVEFEEGRVEKPIGRHPKIRQKMAVSSSSRAKLAQTRYRVIRRFKQATLLDVKILTGRTHQIRVHLTSIGHPVFGDSVYGKGDRAGRLGLHASKISFVHPKTGKIMKFESAWPADFSGLIENQEKLEA
jgi:23S rRNA pseudouridine1911/1915/1917 synthase